MHRVEMRRKRMNLRIGVPRSLILIVEILPIKISQILGEINFVFVLQFSGYATVVRQIAAGCGICKTEGNSIPVGFCEKELQCIVLESILN